MQRGWKTLARKIAADATDFVTLEHARSAAEAEFGIARVRQAKIALIERMLAFGGLEPPQLFQSLREIKAFFKELDRGELNIPTPVVDPLKTMPSAEADRLAEAVRRALPELIRLDRYERCAAALRDRSLRGSKKVELLANYYRELQANWNFAKRSQFSFGFLVTCDIRSGPIEMRYGLPRRRRERDSAPAPRARSEDR